MPENAVIGKRLRELREALSLTQEELAKKIGLNKSTIAMYETGQRIPRDWTKIMLSEVLNQPIEKIFFEPEEGNVDGYKTDA